MAGRFPEECRNLLEVLRDIYQNDTAAREGNLSTEERLHFHRAKSGPLMVELKARLTRQFEDRLMEPNPAPGRGHLLYVEALAETDPIRAPAGSAAGQQRLRAGPQVFTVTWQYVNRSMEPRAPYEARANFAKALAHLTRLTILDALQRREHRVCELTELVGADQSTVSKHLAIMKNVELVEDRKQGAMAYYRLTCPCLGGFFECVESVLRAKLETQAGLLVG